MSKYTWMKPSNLAVFIISVMILSLLLPLILREFYLGIMTFLLINLILTVSFRLITMLGLWSFAHISFMGIGAYVSGLLATQLGWPFWLTLPVGVLATTVVSLLIGFPLLRARFVQFFLASTAAGEAIRWVWIIFREPFGGYYGIGGIPRPNTILGISFAGETGYYYLVLIVTMLSLSIMYRLEHSRIGDTTKSIASNEGLCEAVGINTYAYKVLIFVIASSFAGLAGVLFAHYIGTASPNDFTFVYSINVLVFVIVGGTTYFVGPIVGTVVMMTISELFRGLLEYLPLVYGAILIITVLALPGGLVSLPKRLRRYRMRRKMAG